jgi:hypothetical protein
MDRKKGAKMNSEDSARIWLAHWQQSTTTGGEPSSWLDVVAHELSNGNLWGGSIESIDGELRLGMRGGEQEDQ